MSVPKNHARKKCAFGKPDDDIFGSEKGMEKAKRIAKDNSGMDLNKDGVITMAEFKPWIYRGISNTIRSRLLYLYCRHCLKLTVSNARL